MESNEPPPCVYHCEIRVRATGAGFVGPMDVAARHVGMLIHAHEAVELVAAESHHRSWLQVEVRMALDRVEEHKKNK